ncbi:MAG TPA: hypothetical protein VFB58_13740 [Chloroflexota bacterium]|nr:hypothetical protein [Chloroflexota bacterium]
MPPKKTFRAELHCMGCSARSRAELDSLASPPLCPNCEKDMCVVVRVKATTEPRLEHRVMPGDEELRRAWRPKDRRRPA